MSYDVTVSMDDELRLRMEEVCTDIGLSMSTAFLIFAKRVARERKIPFELSASPMPEDPFYSESNMRHLRRGIAQLNAGKGVRHELIEEDHA